MTEELQRPSSLVLHSYGVSLLVGNLGRCRGRATSQLRCCGLRCKHSHTLIHLRRSVWRCARLLMQDVAPTSCKRRFFSNHVEACVEMMCVMQVFDAFTPVSVCEWVTPVFDRAHVQLRTQCFRTLAITHSRRRLVRIVIAHFAVSPDYHHMLANEPVSEGREMLQHSRRTVGRCGSATCF